MTNSAGYSEALWHCGGSRGSLAPAAPAYLDDVAHGAAVAVVPRGMAVRGGDVVASWQETGGELGKTTLGFF